MTAKGHVVLALTPVVAMFLYKIVDDPLIFLAVIFGSLLPDIDEPNSYIGRRSFFIANFLKYLGVEHRTFTHYLIFPLFVMLVAYIFFGGGLLFWVGFGILMHDVGDMLTKGGIVSFFYPFFPGKRAALMPSYIRFKTFSFAENVFIMALILFNMFLIGQSHVFI